MQTYLMIANRTLGGAELLDVIRDRLTRGPASFWVLVPATPSVHLVNDFNALSCAFPVDPELVSGAADPDAAARAAREAQTRLEAELHRLRTLGASADGAVGDPDPLTAIDKVLAERDFDEIILSTLPPGLSRWLSLDLPHRLRRRTSIPITVVRHDPDNQPSGSQDPERH